MSGHKTEFVLAIKDPKEITSTSYPVSLSDEEREIIASKKDKNPNRKLSTTTTHDRHSQDILVREKAALLVEELYREQLAFNEFLLDARKFPNLSTWETAFIRSLWEGFQRGSLIRFADLSEKMLVAAKKIRKKLYAI